MGAPEALELAAASLQDPAASWSVGTFGALAEFARAADEACEIDDLTVVTGRGGIRVARAPEVRALAYEALSALPGQWHHGVFFCLRRAIAEAAPRRAITELGPDRDAIRAEDRDAILFDLGLGAASFFFCVRTRDAALLAELRRAAGTRLLDPPRGVARLIVEASPHRVAVTRLARVEVYQPIARENDRTPSGPHTHLIPSLLRPALTHSANVAVPAGWVPVLALYPVHPAKDEAGKPKPFEPGAHAAFQALFARYGDPAARAAKAALLAAIERGLPPTPRRLPASRTARAASRIALRQLRLAGAESPALEEWERALERAGRRPAG
jgi:hypothetical protein